MRQHKLIQLQIFTNIRNKIRLCYHKISTYKTSNKIPSRSGNGSLIFIILIIQNETTLRPQFTTGIAAYDSSSHCKETSWIKFTKFFGFKLYNVSYKRALRVVK